MVTAILATMALALSYISVKTSYYVLRFFAGALWWALGVWLIKTPLVAGSDPLNDIMLTICFFGGAAMMFMMGWRTDTVNGREVGNFNIRIPGFLGGQSEEDEFAERRSRAMTSQARRGLYRERTNAATRGRRIPPR